MAIVTPHDYLRVDRRWRHWAKVVRTADDIALDKSGGWSIKSDFLRISDAVAINSGDVLIAGSETGSHRYRSYDYVGVIGLDRRHVIAISTDLPYYSEYQKWRRDKCPEPWAAEARNSAPYRYGLFWHWLHQVLKPTRSKKYLREWLRGVKATQPQAEAQTHGANETPS